MSKPLLVEHYSDSYVPAIPILSIQLSAPEEDNWYGPYPAIVDSGADFSIVPRSIVQELQAPIDRPATLSSHWRDRHAVQIHEVDLRIGTSVLPSIEVAGDPSSTEILLGRNVLNYLDIELDGPKLELRLLNI